MVDEIIIHYVLQKAPEIIPNQFQEGDLGF